MGHCALARPREFDENQVLDAVMTTFWRKGYEATSAQDLVDATGLGRGSLYAAYANKSGLFEQALHRYNQESRKNVERLEAATNVLVGLRELLLSVVNADLGEPENRGCLATNSAIEMAARDPHVADLVRQNFAIVTAGIRDAISRGQEDGEIRTDRDAEGLALFVFNTMQGLRVLSRTARPKEQGALVTIIDQTLEAIT